MVDPLPSSDQGGYERTGSWVPDVVECLLKGEQVVPLFDLLEVEAAIDQLPNTQLRDLYRQLRDQGYLERALKVAATIDARKGNANSSERLRAEVTVLSGSLEIDIEPLDAPFGSKHGRALMVVGSALPDTESSYTRQTHELASIGPSIGLDISVVTQMGIGGSGSYEIEVARGVQYHRIPGPVRGSIPFDHWLRTFAVRLASVVRKVRPSVLIASSDFVNGYAACAVSAQYSIPMIYDVRGLWEDSWLRRQRQKYGWSSSQVPQRWGWPDVWKMRREREFEVMRSARVTVVRSSELADQIIAEGAEEGSVLVVPSGGEPGSWIDAFGRAGALDPDSAALARIRLSGDVFKRHIRSMERRPLGQTETFGSAGSVAKIREHGWKLGSLEPVKIDVPFDWVNACRENRSQAFHLHAWDFMAPFLESWSTHRDRDSLNWCLDRAADWAALFNDGRSHGTMAWYDMAIGLRAPRLAYLVQEGVHENADADLLDRLSQAVVLHQRAIHAPGAFNPATNHGFYTAVGQLSFSSRLAGLPGMNIIYDQGRKRLRLVVAKQFASDGGHLEHSPDYHRMLLSSFLRAMDDGLLTDPEVLSRVRKAEEVMGWFIQPDRSIVQIGDSAGHIAQPSDRAMNGAYAAFLASNGDQGRANPDELLVLPETGYAIVRSPQPFEKGEHLKSGYLTLMAGFHSRAHKHCDDLSLTWFDKGQSILIDAGRFGYLDQLPADSPQRGEGFFYGRPERQYVERTIAHNTVQMDDQEHERRLRAPYGSGILSGQRNGLDFRIAGCVDHATWKHHRSVVYRPGEWLLVRDDVVSQDGQAHDFTVWWNLPESLTEPRVRSDRVSFRMIGGEMLRVTALNHSAVIPPVKGQSAPLRGWRSIHDYEFSPAWSFGHRVRATKAHSFRTLLSLRDISREETAKISGLLADPDYL
ncbi:heparinase II/III domain-containing protein [Sanguibacter sp. Z1732]|uniref:heparinase II/III domain-containing protein n=1 Tax=Sanguibacter sp. Z1732 TaxID=3435412 RepID=UPI003D9C891B